MDLTRAEEAALSEFGRRVNGLRRQRGISQERLGELGALHRTHIGTVEHAVPNPELGTVLRLARALGIDAADLVRGLRT